MLLVNLSCLMKKPTGISTYAKNLFPYLKPVNPILLTAYPNDDSCYQIPDNLSADHGTQGHLRRLIWTQRKLPKIYHENQARLLFSPIPEAPLYSNCRSIVMVHDFIPLRFPRLSPLTVYHRFYIPQVLQQAEHILCNSHSTAEDMVKFFKIKTDKITPIYLAHDSSHFRDLDLPLTNNCPYFIYIGRHDPYKNLQRLIAAFAALPKGSYELWIVGSSDRRFTPSLKLQVKELGIAEKVKFLDYVLYAQLPVMLNKAIALVFPSLWEGFGLPVLEAMACGTPVITSNLSSLPEVAGDAALLVNPYKVGEITAAMKSVAEDSQLRSHLRTLSLERAAQFSWEKTGKATAEVLQQYL